MSVKSSSFVGTFGVINGDKGLQVKFSSDGHLTVNGERTTAEGTYGVAGSKANAVFQATNVTHFQRAIFYLVDGGKRLRFVGPLGRQVTLDRLSQ
jgi:hypothetical protein